MHFNRPEKLIIVLCLIGLAFAAGVWVGRATAPAVKVTVFKR